MRADLRDFVRDHGGALSNGGRRATIPGPGHTKRDRSLSLMLTDDGNVVFNDLSGKHGFHEIRDYLGLERRGPAPDPAEAEAARRRRQDETRRQELQKLTWCKEVMDFSEPARGTRVEAYLASRGLNIPCGDVWYHPAAPRAVPWNRMTDDPAPPPPHPAMICISRNARREARGLHITFLTHEGRKAFGDRSRLMAGPMSGASLQTAPVGADGVLAVGEGMETAGGFSCLRSVPTWAAWSTSGLRNFDIPSNVRRLLIAADHDRNGAGHAAAQALAERAAQRCDVEIHMPDAEGDDWSDVWMREVARG